MVLVESIKMQKGFVLDSSGNKSKIRDNLERYEQEINQIDLVDDERYENKFDYNAVFFKVVKFLVETTMFVFAIDAFAVMKNRSNREVNRYYQVPKLRLKRTKVDELRDYWRIILLTWLFYICFKCIIIASLELLIYSSIENQYTLEEKFPNRTDEFFKGFKLYNLKGELGLKAKRMIDLIGDPLVGICELSLSFSIYLVISIMISIIWPIIQYSYKEQVDAIHIRTAIKPEPELRRIDALIREKLDALIKSAHDFDRKTRHMGRNLILFNDDQPVDSRKLIMILKRLRENYWVMRPLLYTEEYCRKVPRIVSVITLIISFIFLPCPGFMHQAIYVNVYKSQCVVKQIPIKDCGLLKSLNWREMITFMELWICTLFVIYALTLTMLLIISNLYGYLKSLFYLRSHLNECLIELREDNKRQLSGKRTEDDSETFPVETSLMQMLILYRTAEDDIMRNNRLISFFMTIFLLIMNLGMILLLVSGRIQDLGLYSLRSYVFLWLLVTENLVLFGSSYNYVKISDLNKIFWSIMAQVQVRGRLPEQRHWFNFVANNWFRLVKSSRLSDKTNAVSFFHISVTFETMLTLNFVLITIGSLSRSG